MKQYLSSVALPCLFFTVSLLTYAQTPQPAAGADTFKSPVIGIGQGVPDVMITGIINHPAGQAKLSSYRGTWVILDFWATWCSPCIAAFPKADSLNHLFKGKAVIFPVTYQSKEDVTRLFNKIASLKNVKMPMVTSDKLLHGFFPHSELPHYVWIDPQGTVRAITGMKEVNAANITKMMDAPSAVLTEKKDIEILTYDREVPLMFNAVEVAAEDIKYESVLLGYKEGFSSRIDVLRYPDNSLARFTATNTGIKMLYAFAFSTDQEVYKDNRILLEVADTSRLIPPDYYTNSAEQLLRWAKDNTYCYELLLPNVVSKNFSRTMQQDMERAFSQYRATLEPREVKVLALVRTSSQDKIKSRGAASSNVIDKAEFNVTNGTIAFLMSNLNFSLQLLKTPVVDLTGYTGKIDLALNGSQSDVDNLRRELKKYDLDLIYRTATINMIVIRDVK